ncbi:alpha-hydroxy acid oxidase [Hyalangium sp.]|uniref:alpha-hydroxy acid oxidase n=1 Tax=Hyalangium sp. TaxID=2028555 RepID=UPI002D28C0FD|nr:alpha-hydroxy acid oxidase [Hyalangium sp.]HYI00137.1 alpha-hydroxy acid oxidase [Hyalangium sp.]
MIVNLEDLRDHARRRLPRAIFDFVDGGAEDEHTLRANRLAFEKYTFRARALVDVSACDQSTTLLGKPLSTPVILGPAGLAGLLAPRGEVLAARAAEKKGTLFTLSTMSVCPIEEVAAAVPGSSLWFQLYVWKDRGITRSLIERAKAAGYHALCLTVDVPAMGRRERDLRNGFTVPPRVTISNLLDTLLHLGWVFRMLTVPRPTFGNFVGTGKVEKEDAISVATFTNKQFDPSVTWADLEWVRSLWPGPLLLKGISCAEDARLALQHGVQGLIVSNHGGRQLDHLPAAIDLLPEIAEAVEGRAELILDGGIRRGSDVVKAIALGARACMIGRPFLYGLAAREQAGVELMLDLLRAEIDRTLALIGCPRLTDLGPGSLRSEARPQAPEKSMRLMSANNAA